MDPMDPMAHLFEIAALRQLSRHLLKEGTIHAHGHQTWSIRGPTRFGKFILWINGYYVVSIPYTTYLCVSCFFMFLLRLFVPFAFMFVFVHFPMVSSAEKRSEKLPANKKFGNG